jgi:dinuclear metal center YbgI/SA1388 family protein
MGSSVTLPAMPLLSEVIGLLDHWFPPETASDWDAVGLVVGDPQSPVQRILLAVDPAPQVVAEAVQWDADLIVVHHPLLLKPVTSVASNTPKGDRIATLATAGCALFTAHTNADQAVGGVSESLALALGLRDLSPILPLTSAPDTGTGRIGDVDPTTLADFAAAVASALPSTAVGVRVAGQRDRVIRRVAVCGGSGDFLLDDLAHSDIDVYVTSDLRHHRAAEFLEHNGPALIDVAHWAAEWTWLPVTAARLAEALGDNVETRVSLTATDPWTFRI